MTTPLGTLYNIGKLFTIIGAGMFIWLTVMGQLTYWGKGRGVPLNTLPKQYKFLFHAGKWECIILAGWFVLFSLVALCRVLWQLVVTGW